VSATHLEVSSPTGPSHAGPGGLLQQPSPPDTMGGRSSLTPLVVPPVEFSKAAKPRAMQRKGWLDGLQVDVVPQWMIHRARRTASTITGWVKTQTSWRRAAASMLRARFRCAGVRRKQPATSSDRPGLAGAAGEYVRSSRSRQQGRCSACPYPALPRGPYVVAMTSHHQHRVPGQATDLRTGETASSPWMATRSRGHWP
jgi:hypothetical protein